MTGQRLDKALVQPTAVVTGVVPTRSCPRFAGGAVPVKGSSVWSKPLSPERSPFMAIWEPATRGCRCFLQHPGRAEGRGTEAKDLRGWEQQVSTLTIQGEQRRWRLFGAEQWDEWEHQAG